MPRMPPTVSPFASRHQPAGRAPLVQPTQSLKSCLLKSALPFPLLSSAREPSVPRRPTQRRRPCPHYLTMGRGRQEYTCQGSPWPTFSHRGSSIPHCLVGTCFVPGTMVEFGGREINEAIPALRELTMSDEGVTLVLSPNE